MNKLINLSTLFFIIAVALSSCSDNKCEMEYTYVKYKPIFKTNEEVAAEVASEAPRTLQNPGKIFFANNFMYVSETNEGVHVIDNSNPSNPQNIAFIKVPGNVDVAVRNNILYADMYTDVLSIDISNLGAIQILDHERDVFPEYTNLWFTGVEGEEGQIIVDWETEEVTEVLATDCHGNPIFEDGGPWVQDGWVTTFETDLLASNVSTFQGGADMSSRTTGGNTTTNSTNTTNNQNNGRAGSMARFSLHNNVLYLLDNENLKVMDISNPSSLSIVSETYVAWGLETIFPYENNLFIGSMTGMYIFNIGNVTNPTYVSEYNHMTACDPVVVDGDFAYVTLRTGTECWRGVNELHVVDISNIGNPEVAHVYEMFNPHGLGVDGDMLFLCDGDDGLKVFDKSDVSAISSNRIDHFSEINAFDVIPFNNVLMLTGSDGIYQYSYNNNSIAQISVIPVVQ